MLFGHKCLRILQFHLLCIHGIFGHKLFFKITGILTEPINPPQVPPQDAIRSECLLAYQLKLTIKLTAGRMIEAWRPSTATACMLVLKDSYFMVCTLDYLFLLRQRGNREVVSSPDRSIAGI